jgi:hypothetical protein
MVVIPNLNGNDAWQAVTPAVTDHRQVRAS